MLDPRSPMHRYSMDNVTVLPVTELDPSLATGLTWRKDRAEPGATWPSWSTRHDEIFVTPLTV